jgi:Icc protein
LKMIMICLIILFFVLVPEESTSATNQDFLFSFAVLSDIHIQSFDRQSHQLFLRSLEDHKSISPQSSLLILNGDLTDGFDHDYRKLKELLRRVPHPNLFATMGNHDYYQLWDRRHFGKKLNPSWSSEKAKKLFLSHFKYNQVFHDTWLNGCHFIFLSGERYRDVDKSVGESAYLSKEQLRWLEERLRDKPSHPDNEMIPTFVFLHQPIENTISASDEGLFNILDNVKRQVFLFSGHTHQDLEQPEPVSNGHIHMIKSGSVRNVLRDKNKVDKSESLAVEVYRNRIIIKKREHLKRRWILPHTIIDLRNSQVPPLDTISSEVNP